MKPCHYLPASMLVGCACSLLLVGCFAQKAMAADAGIKAELYVSTESYSLVDYFPVAAVSRPLKHIRFAGEEERRFLSSGWNKFEKGGGRTYCWTKDRTAVIDLPIVYPTPLTVRCEMSPPPRSESMPEQTVQVLWNGQAVGTFAVTEAQQIVEFEVPSQFQRPGPNRMELLTEYWVRPDAMGLGSESQSLGVECSNIDYFPYAQEFSGPTPAAVTKDGAIHQAPGVVITYYFVLPQDAVFRAHGVMHIEGAALPSDAHGQVSAHILTEEGQQRAVFRGDIEELVRTPEFDIDQDLSDFAGQMIALSLCFSLNSPTLSAQHQPAQSPKATIRVSPLPDEGDVFGLSAPLFVNGIPAVDTDEDLIVRGWIASNKEHEIAVVFNGTPIETKAQQRGDVVEKYSDHSNVAGFISRIPRDSFQSTNELTILVDGELYRSIGFNLDVRSEQEASQELFGSGLWIEWQEPRVDGVSEDVRIAKAGPSARDINVVMIVFDALRADFTELYGGRTHTPEMNKLARSGVTFLNASANSTWTRTSMTSVFTGLYPMTHQVLNGEASIPPEAPYLPEILRDRGYLTLAVVNNAVMSSAYGVDRGFDRFHEYYAHRESLILKEYPTPESQVDFVWATYIAPSLIESEGRPFFLYLHEIDPHAPYRPPPPYDQLYPFEYNGRIDLPLSNEVLRMVRRKAMILEEADVQYLRAKYMGEIAFMDRYLGSMIGRFTKEGLMENTLFVFLSDHGEEFMEHGGIQHSWSLYEEVLAVPMVWALQGVLPEGHRPVSHAELVDVAPTMLDILGADIPPLMQGRSLLPYMFHDESFRPSRPTFAKLRKTDWESARLGRWKLLNSRNGQIREYRLFDLNQDPEEFVNRWPEELVVGKTLLQMLDWQNYIGIRRNIAPGETVKRDKLSEETVENLRALGYLD